MFIVEIKSEPIEKEKTNSKLTIKNHSNIMFTTKVAFAVAVFGLAFACSQAASGLVKPLVSSNNKALVRIAGHLEVEDERFLAGFRYVSWLATHAIATTGPQEDIVHLNVTTDSGVIIGMEVHKSFSEDKHNYVHLLRVDYPTGQSVRQFSANKLLEPIGTSKTDVHYKCETSVTYKVTDASGSASLVLDVLEFEILGDRKVISEGSFSTPEEMCFL